MSTELYIILSVVEALLLVVILAVALFRIRHWLNAIAAGLATLGSVLGGIEKDLVLIGLAVPRINEPMVDIVAALPGIAEKAEAVARR
ncbi:MAG: hypothetical protein WKF96_23630 [Solirubrobacteraceae bacterium]